MQKKSIARKGGHFEPLELPAEFPVTRPAFSTPPRLPHVHNCFEIGLCRAGAGVFLVEEKIYPCRAGDVVFVNQREFHILERDSPLNSEWRFVNLDPARLLAGWIPPGEAALDVSWCCGRKFQNRVSRDEQPALVALVEDLIEELEREAPGYRSVARALLWAIFTKLRRLELPGKRALPRARGENVERFYPALAYLSSHYMEEVPMAALAVRCHVSLSTFRRGFQQAFGCLPKEYLAEFRMNVAVSLLRATDRPIAQIAQDAGFPTLSNFNRQFKAYFGETPGNIRRG